MSRYDKYEEALSCLSELVTDGVDCTWSQQRELAQDIVDYCNFKMGELAAPEEVRLDPFGVPVDTRGM